MTDIFEAVAEQLKRQSPGNRGLQELWQSIGAAVQEAGPDAATNVIKEAWSAKSEQLDQALAGLKQLL